MKCKAMQRQWVESSVLASVGYDRGRGVLEVEFKNGGVYQYFSVPGRVAEELAAAGSHGQFFSKQIRDRFRNRKVH
jgi:hypothetical protein